MVRRPPGSTRTATRFHDTTLVRSDAPIEGRRRPGRIETFPPPVTQTNPGAVRAPPPEAFPADQLPLPDRWRVIQTLGLVHKHWFDPRSEEHTSELQSLMRISYAVFCLKKKNNQHANIHTPDN